MDFGQIEEINIRGKDIGKITDGQNRTLWRKKFSVSSTVKPLNSGNVTGVGQYFFEDNCTLNAIPNEGYGFVNWSDEDVNNPRYINLVQNNYTLTAIFQESVKEQQFVAGTQYIIYSSSDGLDWVSRFPESYGSVSFSCATYGNGQFVMINPNIAYYTSENGINWTRRTNLTGNYHDIVFGDGKFVTVGNSVISYSTDNCVSWNRTDFSSTDFNGISYGNGKFVAVGGNGIIKHTSDPATWNDSSQSIDKDFNDIAYGNNIFVAIGVDGIIYTSTDGGSWTKQDSPTTTNLTSITFGGGLFRALGSNGILITSTNGTSWSYKNQFSVLSNNEDIIYSQGKFIVITDSSNKLYYSTNNGTSWTSANIPERFYCIATK